MNCDFFKKTYECIKIILIFIIMLFLIRTFIGQSAITNGESMAPTTTHGDRIFVEKFSYIFSSPNKEDIIIFPNNNSLLIKRIIGIPGDVIDIKDNYIYVNNEKLDDEFSDRVTSFGNVDFPITVKDGTYFVLGDNRSISKDSRFEEVGLVDEKEIIGRATLIYYPFSNFGILK